MTIERGVVEGCRYIADFHSNDTAKGKANDIERYRGSVTVSSQVTSSVCPEDSHQRGLTTRAEHRNRPSYLSLLLFLLPPPLPFRSRSNLTAFWTSSDFCWLVRGVLASTGLTGVLIAWRVAFPGFTRFTLEGATGFNRPLSASSATFADTARRSASAEGGLG